MLSAQEAIKAARALQANERDALREAGRKKLDEYRKLKAALLNGDLIQVQTQQRTFSSSNLAAAAGTSSPPPEQQHQQQQPEPSRSDAHDPMVDVLLAQVESLMTDKQKLTAQCSSLQRENEQLVELVGYLSIEQQQLLEQQHQLQKVLLNVHSGELLEDGSWSLEQYQQQAHAQQVQQQSTLHGHAVGAADAMFLDSEPLQVTSSDSSMDAVYSSDDDTVGSSSR